jgi:hypothetical protein
MCPHKDRSPVVMSGPSDCTQGGASRSASSAMAEAQAEQRMVSDARSPPVNTMRRGPPQVLHLSRSVSSGVPDKAVFRICCQAAFISGESAIRRFLRRTTEFQDARPGSHGKQDRALRRCLNRWARRRAFRHSISTPLVSERAARDEFSSSAVQ